MRFRRPCCIKFFVPVMLLATCNAEDWPQWRGVNRDDLSQETGLIDSWPTDGPARVWLFSEAGAGYSGVAISDGQLFTMGTRDDATVLLALDADSGTELWATSISTVLTNGWGDGPRGTPTVDGERVYALSGEGDLVCAQVSDGTIVWKKSLVKDFGGGKPEWGYSESVLIDDDRLVCTPGGNDGAVVALNKMTGESLWQTTDVNDGAQYASVLPVDLDGQRTYIQLFQKRVVGVSAATGNLLWQANFDGRVAVIPTPIYDDHRLYICAGYGVGCKLVKIEDSQATEVYSNKTMKNHHGGVILVDGKLYGHSDKVGWVCQDFASGEKIWNQRGKLGKGAVGFADGKLYCVDERDGTVCLVDASPDGWKERGRFQLSPLSENRSSRGGIWTHPVIANGKLYLRDQEYIYCFDVKQ